MQRLSIRHVIRVYGNGLSWIFVTCFHLRRFWYCHFSSTFTCSSVCTWNTLFNRFALWICCAVGFEFRLEGGFRVARNGKCVFACWEYELVMWILGFGLVDFCLLVVFEVITYARYAGLCFIWQWSVRVHENLWNWSEWESVEIVHGDSNCSGLSRGLLA